MLTGLLSVVVPVYNVKEYVEECITSILNQTYTNIELILVINGPTDGSDEICRQFAERDKRIKLVGIKENQGVCWAWKKGTDAASGEYITFVDADDYILGDYFQQLMSFKNYDIVSTAYDKIERSGIYRVANLVAAGLYDKGEKLDYVLSNMLCFENRKCVAGIHPSVWGKRMKTDMVQECWDEINDDFAYFVDVVFSCCILLKCDNIYVSEFSGYCWRTRAGSSTHSAIKDYWGGVGGSTISC